MRIEVFDKEGEKLQLKCSSHQLRVNLEESHFKSDNNLILFTVVDKPYRANGATAKWFQR